MQMFVFVEINNLKQNAEITLIWTFLIIMSSYEKEFWIWILILVMYNQKILQCISTVLMWVMFMTPYQMLTVCDGMKWDVYHRPSAVTPTQNALRVHAEPLSHSWTFSACHCWHFLYASLIPTQQQTINSLPSHQSCFAKSQLSWQRFCCTAGICFVSPFHLFIQLVC